MINKISVLLADDNVKLTRELTDYMNSQSDMRVCATADNGKSALELIKTYQPDVVILDMVMPELDGIGVLKRLNELELAKKPSVIAFSISALEKTVETAMNLGADYYMLKPQPPERICEAVRDFSNKENQITAPVRVQTQSDL